MLPFCIPILEARSEQISKGRSGLKQGERREGEVELTGRPPARKSVHTVSVKQGVPLRARI